jgi:hypothetical protein
MPRWTVRSCGLREERRATSSEPRRRPVAKYGTFAARENRSKPPPLLRDAFVTDRIDPAVELVESAGP